MHSNRQIPRWTTRLAAVLLAALVASVAPTPASASGWQDDASLEVGGLLVGSPNDAYAGVAVGVRGSLGGNELSLGAGVLGPWGAVRLSLGYARVARWRAVRLAFGVRAVAIDSDLLPLPILSFALGGTDPGDLLAELRIANPEAHAMAFDLAGVGVRYHPHSSLLRSVGADIVLSALNRLSVAAELHASFAAGALAVTGFLRAGTRPYFGSVFVAAGVSLSFGERPHFEPRDPPPDFDPAPAAPRKLGYWPNVHALLRPGRRFFLRYGPLRAAEGQVIPKSQDVVCTVDEVNDVRETRWFHVQCSAELPDGAPDSWRTGCYRRDQDGIWRVPHCPSGPRTAAAGREDRLLLPAAEPSARGGSKFVELSRGVVVATELKIGAERHPASCVIEYFAGRTLRCYDDSVGLRWSAQRWHEHPEDDAEAGVLTVHSDLQGETLPDAPHLQFEDAASSTCATSTGCAALGTCRLSSGICVAASDAHCRRAESCRVAGLCRARAGACDVGDDADCAASRVCQEKGACKRGEGRCVVPTEGAPAPAPMPHPVTPTAPPTH
ncbi:MAG: hypothetical protein H6747_05395 [Deltaproteobacteria bacterium]|nr:hypothetical protein [Deltaproteobacteria bacterium]